MFRDSANFLIYQLEVGIKGVVWPQRKPFQSFNRFASFKSFKPLSEWIRLAFLTLKRAC